MPRKAATKTSKSVGTPATPGKRAPKWMELYELVGKTKEGLPLYLPKGARTDLFDRVGLALERMRAQRKKSSPRAGI